MYAARVLVALSTLLNLITAAPQLAVPTLGVPPLGPSTGTGPYKTITPPAKCLQGAYIIVTKGHKRAGGPFGEMNAVTARLINSIPGSVRISNPYPEVSLLIPLAVDNGTQFINDQITGYVKNCPTGKVVLFGYSEGGVTTMDSVCGCSVIGLIPRNPLPATYTKNVVATILLGEESRVPNQPWNRGTCKTSPGALLRTDPAACDPYGPGMLDFCDKDDPDCCLGGLNQTKHSEYDNLYDKYIYNFIMKRYQKFP